MAIVANTFTTFDAKGIREDLTDTIFNISPEETPLSSSIGRGKMTTTLHEWQTDALVAAVTTNAQLEGDDVTTYAAVTPTVRIGNIAQISRKTLILSATEEAVDKAGRKSEEAYQMAMRGVEIKRDVEATLFANQAAAAGSTTLLAFIKTNVDKEAGGVNPVYTSLPNDVRTDGTPRTLTTTIFKAVISLAWTNGANIDAMTVHVGATQKAVISGFAGIATKTWNMSGTSTAVITAAADVFVSDFGVVKVIPNRYVRSLDAVFVDPQYVKLLFLRRFERVELAKTGDADKRMIVGEWALKVGTEKALGLATDLS